MEPGQGRGHSLSTGLHGGGSAESEALLSVFRPYCMSAVMALEGFLATTANPQVGQDAPANGPRTSSPSSSNAAARIAAGRKLEASLDSLRSALGTIVASPALSPSASPSFSNSPGGLRRAFPATLPFVMLPLELTLQPRGVGNAGGGNVGVKGAGADAGAVHDGGVPAGAKEKALLCIVEAIRGSGSRFVEGYGTDPTIRMLVRLVFTLSACSPKNGGKLAQHQDGSSNGDARPAEAEGGGKIGRAGGGSGLTAGTDALRLACLACLETFLRAPFAGTGEHKSSSSDGIGEKGSTSTSNNQAAWSEAQNYLMNAVGGGMLAQLVQELLLCCQQGEAASSSSSSSSSMPLASRGALAHTTGTAVRTASDASGGERSGAWGGAEEARSAANCLHALCSFTPGADVWRRMLPGAFSGLFRAIRGIETGPRGAYSGSGSGSGSGAVLSLGSLALGSQSLSPGGGGGGKRRGGGSKSALAEACLGILGRVLVMCADGGTGGGRDVERARPSAGGTLEEDRRDDPLLALQRLAIDSNAAASSDGRRDGGGRPSAPPPKSAAQASAAAAAAVVIKVEDPEWEERTSDRLRILLPPLLMFCCLHPGWRVRRATAVFASDLLWASCGGIGGGGGGGGGGSGRGGGGGTVEGAAKGGCGTEMRGGRLLVPLRPLLVEALVGLLLDDMPQVSAAARRGVDSFRATLAPLRWLELRGVFLERLCTVAEGLPALAKSADEKRLRAALDLLAGYLSLLRFDARAAFDGRLSLVLSCLCDALEFDEDFNVQVLESSSAGGGSGRHGDETGVGGNQAYPKYYRQVFTNVREESTLASARRAVRLLGKFCDLPSLADAAISALETRPPRPPPAPARATAITTDVSISPYRGTSGEYGGGGASKSSRNNAIFRQRCLKWLRVRLPLAWVLNQTLLGRAPGYGDARDGNSGSGGSGGSGGSSAAARVDDLRRGGGGGVGGADPEPGASTAAAVGEEVAEQEVKARFLGRGLALSMLERLLASHAFALPVSRAEAAAAGFSGESYGSRSDGGGGGGFDRLDSSAMGPTPRAIEYTRSGAVLGAAKETRTRSSGVSGQILDANATLVSTVVETLGSLAEAAGPDFGEAFLRRALYPLLEKAASAHPVVSQAALATLARVRSACGDFEDMPRLLEANMDYVVDDVVRQVSFARRRGAGAVGAHVGAVVRGSAEHSSRIPSVVEAVLRIGGSAMGPALVRDLAGVTLREVDACAWDPRQTRRSLGVLRAVVSCVTLPTPSSPGGDAQSSERGRLPSNSSTAKQGQDERATGRVQAEADAVVEEDRVRDKCKGGEEMKGGGSGVSALAESPWFRQLFVEFADASDIRRVEEEEEKASRFAEGTGDGTGGTARRPSTTTSQLLRAVKEHREAMGFDEPDGNDEGGAGARAGDDKGEALREGSEARWRQIEEETRKAAGPAGGGELPDWNVGGEEALPEPDEEGKRVAESEEACLIARSSSSTLAVEPRGLLLTALLLSQKKAAAEVKTLSEVLARSCHFLATPSLETQALALACVRDCVMKLASAGADAALLPHVHRAWRPLMASLREHLTPFPSLLPAVSSGGVGGGGGDSSYNDTPSLASRRAVLLHALDTVDALVDVCGDFLSSKVSEDLWPLLKLLLLEYAASKTSGTTRSSAEMTRGRRQALHSSNLVSSTSPTLGLSPSASASASPEGLFLGRDGGDSIDGVGGGVGYGSGNAVANALSSLRINPSEEWTRDRDGGDGARGGVRTTVGEKVVARALSCLERLCCSEECEQFMTPLAREVALAALPCLSSAGADFVRAQAETLFRRLAFLDGDGVWLLLMQTMDTAAQHHHNILHDSERDTRSSLQQRPRGNSVGSGAPIKGTREIKGGTGRGFRRHVVTSELLAPRTAGQQQGSGGSSSGGGGAEDTRVMSRWTGLGSSRATAAFPGLLPLPACERHGRPTALSEERSVFAGRPGRVAGDCAPAAARILELLIDDDAVINEHM